MRSAEFRWSCSDAWKVERCSRASIRKETGNTGTYRYGGIASIQMTTGDYKFESQAGMVRHGGQKPYWKSVDYWPLLRTSFESCSLVIDVIFNEKGRIRSR